MPFRDLRKFIQKCEETGDLIRVKEEIYQTLLVKDGPCKGICAWEMK